MFIERFAIAALFLVPCGQTQGAPSVDEVRSTARVLLQSMCGQQCDVIDVRIKSKRAAPAGSMSPGFDESPQPRMLPGEIDLALLFDSKLPAPYRKFVAERVKQRVGEFGLPVLLTEEVKPFPAPPEPAPEPAKIAPQPTPAPQAIQPPPVAPAPAPLPVSGPDLERVLALRLIESLPLLLAFGLLAWLVLRVLKRMDQLAGAGGRGPNLAQELDPVTLTPELVEDSRPPERAAFVLPPPSPERLAEDLRRHRGSTRRIFGRLLTRGEHDTVARAVALLGDFVVEDLSHDPGLRPALQAAGHRTAEILRAPMTDEDSEEVLRSVQAELVADRVAHRADDVRKELEVLLGWGPEAFAAIMSRLDDRLGVLLLRHAPGHLSESYLAGLPDEVRGRTVRELLAEPAAEPEEMELLVESIGAHENAALVGGYEADHIVDLLDSLPAKEQELVVSDLESARPEFVRRNLGQLPIESALLRVPEQALAAAFAVVPIEDWLAYLRVAPHGIKERAIAACPSRLRDGLMEELGLRIAPDLERATLARRRIVRAALSAAPRAHNGAGALPAVVQRNDTAQGRMALEHKAGPDEPGPTGRETKR